MDTPERAHPVVQPDEFSMFTDIACKFGWPSLGKTAYLRAADESGQLLKKTEVLRIYSRRLLHESRRSLADSSKQRRRIAKTEVKSLLDKIQRQYGEFLTERGPMSSNFAELSRRDSLLWSQVLPPTPEFWAKRVNKPAERNRLIDELKSRVGRVLSEFDARSDLLALRHAFEASQREEVAIAAPKSRSREQSPSSLFKWMLVNDQSTCFREIDSNACESIELEDLRERQFLNDGLRLACFIVIGDLLPLFTIDFASEDHLNGDNLIIDLRYIPKVAPADVWEIESLLFVSQLDLTSFDANTTVIERAFKGDCIYESEHSGFGSEYSRPLFTKWTELTIREGTSNCQGLTMEEGNGQIRYADVLADNLTFYMQTLASNTEDFFAGLIANAPLEEKQISAFAKLLHLTNRLRLTQEIYEELLQDVIKRLPNSRKL